jgi:hypothetical protein
MFMATVHKNTMKNLIKVFTLCAIILSTGCYTTRTAGNSGKVPPGQAKKARGSKSAKPFAPGQRKKY